MAGRRARLIAASGLVVTLLACGESDRPPAAAGSSSTETLPASSALRRLAGAWSLASFERRDAEGDPLSPPAEDRLGHLIYDAAGYLGVTIMGPDLAQFGSYTSYFGRFAVDEAAGTVTHHIEGSLDPNAVGADHTRFYTLTADRLTLRPPAGADGSETVATWIRQPDLPASEVSDTHPRLFGTFRIDSVSRNTTDGYPIDVDQYDSGYLFYAPSGHMAVHLMRPGRAPYAGDRPTAEEALRLTESYSSYFGPFSMHEVAGCITCPGPRDQGYLVHHRVGPEDPRSNGSDARRYYELTDTHLTLRPPVHSDDQGRQVVTAVRWVRLSLP